MKGKEKHVRIPLLQQMFKIIDFARTEEPSSFKSSQRHFKAGLKLVLKIVEARLHTTFSVCDQLLLNCRCRCQSWPHGWKQQLFELSRNKLTARTHHPRDCRLLSRINLEKSSLLWVLEECHHRLPGCWQRSLYLCRNRSISPNWSNS